MSALTKAIALGAAVGAVLHRQAARLERLEREQNGQALDIAAIDRGLADLERTVGDVERARVRLGLQLGNEVADHADRLQRLEDITGGPNADDDSGGGGS